MRRSPPHRQLFVLIVLAACADDPVTDGIDVDALPQLTLEEDLRIGSVDDPDYGFSSITTAMADLDGRVYVFEALDHQIRVYDTDGRLLHRIGRQGRGPGEFVELVFNMGVVGDTVWVIADRRITLFNRDGRLLMTSAPIQGVIVPLQGTGTIGLVLPVRMRADGRFWGSMYTSRPPQGMTASGIPETDTIFVPRVLFDATGAVLDTLGFDMRPPPPAPLPPAEHVRMGGLRFRVPPPPYGRPISATLDDGRIWIDRPVPTSPDTGSFTVTVLGLDRDTLFHSRYRYTPRPYTQAMLDSLALRAVRAGSADPTDEMRQAVRARMEFPESMPPIGFFRRGADGTLWLSRYDDLESPIAWILLHPDGSPLGELRVPRDVAILWSNEETLIAVAHDEFNVPWIVKYRIHSIR